jgi:hypothetical protein
LDILWYGLDALIPLTLMAAEVSPCVGHQDYPCAVLDAPATKSLLGTLEGLERCLKLAPPQRPTPGVKDRIKGLESATRRLGNCLTKQLVHKCGHEDCTGDAQTIRESLAWFGCRGRSEQSPCKTEDQSKWMICDRVQGFQLCTDRLINPAEADAFPTSLRSVSGGPLLLAM